MARFTQRAFLLQSDEDRLSLIRGICPACYILFMIEARNRLHHVMLGRLCV